MINPYSGPVLRAYEAVTENRPHYRTNTPYMGKNGHIYYINRKGFLHVYSVEKARLNGKRVYYLIDQLLTAGGVFKESGREFYSTMEKIEKRIINLESIAKKNNAREGYSHESY